MTGLSGASGPTSAKNLLLPAIALVVLVVLYVAQKKLGGPAPEDAAPTETTRSAAPGPEERAGPPREKEKAEPSALAIARAGSELERRGARERRDLILAGVREALERRVAREDPGEAGADDADDARPPHRETLLGSLDRDYIQTRIKDDLIPLARECYESALEDEQALAGTLVMQFTIVGDEEVGGVVDGAEVGDDSTIAHPLMRECVRESLNTVTFTAPEGGGEVRVTYPFKFSPDGPEGGEGGAPPPEQ